MDPRVLSILQSIHYIEATGHAPNFYNYCLTDLKTYVFLPSDLFDLVLSYFGDPPLIAVQLRRIHETKDSALYWLDNTMEKMADCNIPKITGLLLTDTCVVHIECLRLQSDPLKFRWSLQGDKTVLKKRTIDLECLNLISKQAMFTGKSSMKGLMYRFGLWPSEEEQRKRKVFKTLGRKRRFMFVDVTWSEEELEATIDVYKRVYAYFKKDLFAPTPCESK